MAVTGVGILTGLVWLLDLLGFGQEEGLFPELKRQVNRFPRDWILVSRSHVPKGASGPRARGAGVLKIEQTVLSRGGHA